MFYNPRPCQVNNYRVSGSQTPAGLHREPATSRWTGWAAAAAVAAVVIEGRFSNTFTQAQAPFFFFFEVRKQFDKRRTVIVASHGGSKNVIIFKFKHQKLGWWRWGGWSKVWLFFVFHTRYMRHWCRLHSWSCLNQHPDSVWISKLLFLFMWSESASVILSFLQNCCTSWTLSTPTLPSSLGSQTSALDLYQC